MQGSSPLDKPKRGRGRPRKDPGSSQVEQVPKLDQKQEMPGVSGEGERSIKAQWDSKRKGKAREAEEDYIEDIVDEEEQCGPADVPTDADELRKFSARLSDDKVDYEPYVRKTHQEEEDELDDVFNELKTVVTTTAVYFRSITFDSFFPNTSSRGFLRSRRFSQDIKIDNPSCKRSL
jgi:hypothetical protein